MGSLDRSKKRVQLWKKAVFHFLLCFVMGFFTGLAPTGNASNFLGRVASNQLVASREFSPEPIETLHHATRVGNLNRSLLGKTPQVAPSSFGDSRTTFRVEENEAELIPPRKLLIVITPTRSNNWFQGALLRRLGNTLKLVPPPLLWIIVESQSDSSELSEIMRKTGIMYRHLVYKENFTDPKAEMAHQRNVALNHIEHHRLNGIVHFAGVSNVYDVGFFNEIREIEDFGTWPMALLSANRKRVVIEGPVCASSQVIGWHLRNMNDPTNMGSSIRISGFGFNSSILWDPQRWGRPSSVQETSQNSVKFVQQVVLEDETKLKGIPEGDCSKIKLWHLSLPTRKLLNQPISNHPIRR